MAIMMGMGGYTLFEVQKKLDQSNQLLANGQENIQKLEDRLAATGTDVSKTLQILKGKVDTNISEVDKLWAVSYRQNRPRIEALEADLVKKTNNLSQQIAPMTEQMSSVNKGFKKLNTDMVELRQQLIIENEEATTQVSLVRNQIQDQEVLVEGNKRNIAILTKKLAEAEEAIDVMDRYRQQINKRIVDLQSQVQSEASGSATGPAVAPVPAN